MFPVSGHPFFQALVWFAAPAAVELTLLLRM